MDVANRFQFVPIMSSTNIGAGVDGKSINMGKAHRVKLIIVFGALGADSATLKLYSGATTGVKTSALTFKYAIGAAAIGSALSDTLGTEAAVDSLTLTNTLHGSKMLIAEIDSSKMDLANNEEWLTVELSSGATSGPCVIIAVVEPRYVSGATVIA